MERLSSGMGGEMRKGPWTSDEDRILSSYVQENGPGNWASVPTITGIYTLKFFISSYFIN